MCGKVKKYGPNLGESLERVVDFSTFAAAAVEENRTLEGILVEGATLVGADLSELVVRGAHFVRCRFLNCSLGGADFTDVVCEGCDWSGSRMPRSFWQRAVWNDCKGTGADLSGASFRDIRFTGCRLDYGNFSACTFRDCAFSGCDLKGAYLRECRVKNLALEKCQIVETSFFRTSLAGLDLTTCRLEGIIISQGGEELKGVIVDPFQAVELAKRLGIVVKM